MTGLSTWISLTALSRTYFIIAIYEVVKSHMIMNIHLIRHSLVVICGHELIRKTCHDNIDVYNMYHMCYDRHNIY